MKKIINLISKYKERIVMCNFIILFGIIIGLSAKIEKLHIALESEIAKPPIYIHDTKIETVEKEVVIEKEVYKDTPDLSFFKNIELNIASIPQYSEPTTDCNMISLEIILEYYGYNLNKDNSFEEIFSLKSSNSHEMQPNTLIDITNAYLQSQGSVLLAKDIGGSSLEDICTYVKDGFPVITWILPDTQELSNNEVKILETGENEYSNSITGHCVVIIGFTENTYIIADPLKGIVEYNKEIFESRFDKMNRRAIVVQ